MSPKKRRKENRGLPERWRKRFGKYRYIPPADQRHHWDGKKEFTLAATLSESHRIFAQRMALVEQEFSIDLEFPNMKSLIDRYLTVVMPTKSVATQDPEIRSAASLIDIYGHIAPAAMTHKIINKVKTATAAKRGARTANAHLALLSHIFTMGIEWGALDDHPMLNKKVRRVPMPGSDKVNKYIPTPDELAAALKLANPTIRAYVEIKDRTGLRMTDMMLIKLSDIRGDELHVTLSKTGKKKIYEIHDDLGEWIAKARINNRVTKKDKKSYHSEYLFQTRDGKPYIDDRKNCSGFNSMWQRWQRKVAAAGLPKFAERYLRTKVANESDSDEAARDLLGHEDIKTTRKHYRTEADRVVPLRKK